MSELEDVGLGVFTPQFPGDWVGANHWVEGVDVGKVFDSIGIG